VSLARKDGEDILTHFFRQLAIPGSTQCQAVHHPNVALDKLSEG
jgi:hypothetical protein